MSKRTITVKEIGIKQPVGFHNYRRTKLGFSYTRNQEMVCLGRYMQEYGIVQISIK
jgi:hypothetical protein